MSIVLSLSRVGAVAFAAVVAPVVMKVSAQPTYAERYRPQYHFTPASNWMNDPNGRVFFNGTYHLFYQYNPFADTWGHMSWGHAVSSDLVHWQHRPVAIPEENSVMAFSGSAVFDSANTSGFGTSANPPLVAIYTGHRTDRRSQSQYLAYSIDSGRTWPRYAGNPVLDLGTPEFRDPAVMWYAPRRQWIMTVALPVDHKVAFYGSRDLKKWTKLSDFGPAGAVAGVWECPDLVELPIDGSGTETRWVLIVSVNPGGLTGGSGTQYFVGRFDGERFVPDDGSSPQTRWTDYGRDFYAGNLFSNVPRNNGQHRAIWIGWMTNLEYAGKTPTSPWRSAQSIPRVLSLTRTAEGVRLVQQPIRELESLRGQRVHLDSRAIPEGTIELGGQGVRGNAIELQLEIDPGSATETGVKVRVGANEETLIGYDAKRREIFVDRTRAGDASWNPQFASRQAAPIGGQNRPIKLRIFVDWSSVEVFGDDGRVMLTELIYPSPQSAGVAVYAKGGQARLNTLDAWPMNSAWRTMDTSSGMTGNRKAPRGWLDEF